MIQVRNVSKSFGKTQVLKNVTIDFSQGVAVIMGQSGAGKSTLLRCINGLEKIDGGDIVVDNLSINDKKNVREIREKCTMVFQQFNLFPHLNALENITLSPIHVLKMEKDQAEKKATALLEMVGLGEKAKSYPSQLSGGQQQRVAIARALMMEPMALLLDEITSALDPEMTAEVLDVIERVARKGTTMIVVTHELSFARKVADRIVFLENGTIHADMKTEEFFNTQNERINRFLQKIEFS
jgi:ABC-type polar amino acid transport system ATPase subunit